MFSGLTNLATDDWRKKKLIKTIDKTRELRDMRRRGKVGSDLAKQKHYILSIRLSTNHTGKHVIILRPNDFDQYFVLDGIGPPNKSILTLPRENFTKHNPYDSNTFLMGKNPEWDALNAKIKPKLNELFKPGTIIRLPSPLYENDRNRDRLFKISSFVWTENKNKPSWFGNYKFSIRYTSRNQLEIPVSIKVYGKFLTDKEKATILNKDNATKKKTIDYSTLNKPKTDKVDNSTQSNLSKFKEIINTSCDRHMNSAKNIIKGFSSSKQFEAEMKRASQANNIMTAAGAAVPTVGAAMVPTTMAVPLQYGMVPRPTVPIYNAPYRIPIAVPIRPPRWSGGKQKTKKKRNKRNKRNKRKKTIRKKPKINKKIRKTQKTTLKPTLKTIRNTIRNTKRKTKRKNHKL